MSIDNVIPIDAEWAAKIFSPSQTREGFNSKTDEVRTFPPSYSTGLYGVAVSGVPDLVVGRVNITGHTELCAAEIKKRSEFTQLPAKRVDTYLKKQDSGYCWHLEDACVFKEPIDFYSDGQTTKGAPRDRKQPEVEQQILRATCMNKPSEEEEKV